jgi:transcriptional regulator with XRE-family HTH domain
VYFCTIFKDKNMKLNRIKEVLDEKGISQTWLAKRLDKSFNSVNSYVCNRTQPNLETLLQISQILNVDLKDLIADQEQINE